MPYAIITQDKPDHLELRNAVRAEHLDYLVANQHKMLGLLIEFIDFQPICIFFFPL